MKRRMLLNKEVSAQKFLLFGVLGLILCLVFVSCENYQSISQWKDKNLVVDGQSGDWLNALTYVEEFNISVGIVHDRDFLYLCAVVENPLVRMRVMRQGLTVWFDPDGGRKKTLGIRFPLGSLGGGGLPAEFEENPDMEKMQPWYDANKDRFPKGERMLCGHPLSQENCANILLSGQQRQRRAAALEMALANPGTPLFETRAPGRRQLKNLSG